MLSYKSVLFLRVIGQMLEALERLMRLHLICKRAAPGLLALLIVIVEHLQEIQIIQAQAATSHHVKMLILVFHFCSFVKKGYLLHAILVLSCVDNLLS